jgi:nucleoside-diphosphate-sugar epimerase
MVELAEKIANLAGVLYDYKGKVVRRNSPDKKYLVDNPDRRCPDISKARAELGYNPLISLDEGLGRSLIWYQDNRATGEIL